MWSRLARFVALPFLLSLLGMYIGLMPVVAQTASSDQESEEGPEMILKRIEYFYYQRAYPLKHIPAGARLHALEQLQAMQAGESSGKGNANQSTPSWAQVGSSSGPFSMFAQGNQPASSWGQLDRTISSLKAIRGLAIQRPQVG